MKIRTLIVTLLALIGILICFWRYDRKRNEFYRSMREFSEVCSIAECMAEYASHHDGHMPSSWDALVGSGLANPIDNEKLEIIHARRPDGSPVSETIDPNDYVIAFGVNLRELHEKDKKLFNKEGQQVLLIMPAVHSLLNDVQFSNMSYHLYWRATEKEGSTP